MHQEQELGLARKEVAATVLLKENLARQKEENSRTSAWQAEQAAIMEEEKARIKEESQMLVLSELARYKNILDDQAQERKEKIGRGD